MTTLEYAQPRAYDAETVDVLLSALHCVLNVEGPAMDSYRASLGVVGPQLDVPYHFEVVRHALAIAEGRSYPHPDTAEAR